MADLAIWETEPVIASVSFHSPHPERLSSVNRLLALNIHLPPRISAMASVSRIESQIPARSRISNASSASVARGSREFAIRSTDFEKSGSLSVTLSNRFQNPIRFTEL